VEAKFTLLRAIGAANDTFLANLARHQERGENEAPPGLGAVAEAYERLSAPVGAMIQSLLEMGKGRYAELAQRYEAIDRELARKFSGSQTPIDPAHCQALHDIARLVHQRAMEEMLAIEELTADERRACRRLVWNRPMEVRLLDLGGAVGPKAGRDVALSDVTSVPLHALLEGMLDQRLRWAGPVGFDLKGFVSVVVRSAADDQRYGQPTYALCSADYLHLASRLAYHFVLVDALCGESLNENYVRFRFHGGAAAAERREWRGQFLVTVLEYNRFLVTHVGDRVNAILPGRSVEELENALVMLGRLMVASRHLDMVIESPAVAAALARAFLDGDYGFERVRTHERA
jgi:pyruvate,water dikinase